MVWTLFTDHQVTQAFLVPVNTKEMSLISEVVQLVSSCFVFPSTFQAKLLFFFSANYLRKEKQK